METSDAQARWRTIETCPYETRVLLWFVTVPDHEGHKGPDGVVIGQRSFYESGKFWDGYTLRPMEWVTHWMPVPAGPNTPQMR